MLGVQRTVLVSGRTDALVFGVQRKKERNKFQSVVERSILDSIIVPAILTEQPIYTTYDDVPGSLYNASHIVKRFNHYWYVCWYSCGTVGRLKCADYLQTPSRHIFSPYSNVN